MPKPITHLCFACFGAGAAGAAVSNTGCTLRPIIKIIIGLRLHRSECSTERKCHGSESSLCGLFAPTNESAKERKGLDSLPRWHPIDLPPPIVADDNNNAIPMLLVIHNDKNDFCLYFYISHGAIFVA